MRHSTVLGQVRGLYALTIIEIRATGKYLLARSCIDIVFSSRLAKSNVRHCVLRIKLNMRLMTMMAFLSAASDGESGQRTPCWVNPVSRRCTHLGRCQLRIRQKSRVGNEVLITRLAHDQVGYKASGREHPVSLYVSLPYSPAVSVSVMVIKLLLTDHKLSLK